MNGRGWTDVINQCLARGEFRIEHLVDDTYWNSDLHVHGYYECMLFLNGNIALQVEDNTVSLAPNSLFLLRPNQMHRPVIQDMDVAYDRYILQISPAMLNTLSSPQLDLISCFQAQPFEAKQLPFVEKQALVEQYEKLLSRAVSTDFGSDLLAQTALVETIIMICGLFCKPRADLGGPSVARGQLVSHVIDYIESHIQGNISLDDLASEIHLSKHYLSRIFKQETNVSIYKFILQKRMVYAGELLEQGESPSDVYLMCGFSDYSNFYRAFRSEYGISPREYQQGFLKYKGPAEPVFVAGGVFPVSAGCRVYS